MCQPGDPGDCGWGKEIRTKKTGQQPEIEEWKMKIFKFDTKSCGKTLEEVFKPESVVKADLDR